MRSRIVILPGWAYPAESLQPLAAELSSHFDEISELDHERPAWVLGWSLGGMQAIKLAVEKPSQVLGLILIASTARFCITLDYEAGQPMAAVRAMSQQLASRPADVLRDFYRRAAQPNPCLEADLSRRIAAGLQVGEEQLKKGLLYLQQTDLRQAAATVRVPTVILHGRNDLVIPVAAARELARLIQGARLIIHESEGHELPLREPAWVASHILQHCMTTR